MLAFGLYLQVSILQTVELFLFNPIQFLDYGQTTTVFEVMVFELQKRSISDVFYLCENSPLAAFSRAF